MKILQFGFGGDALNVDLPHNYVRNCAAYTGTHDNDTVVGWFRSQGGNTRSHCQKYLGTDGSDIHWDMIRAVWASVANTAVVPMQDVLGLGSEARMNLPASEGGNWKWRLEPDAITPELTSRLAEMTELYGRRRVSE
jgi:4-alpha-glucanotransferase